MLRTQHLLPIIPHCRLSTQLHVQQHSAESKPLLAGLQASPAHRLRPTQQAAKAAAIDSAVFQQAQNLSRAVPLELSGIW